MSETPSNWDKLSDVEKAKYFAAAGVPYMVKLYAEQGALDSLPEIDQRRIVAQSLLALADIRDAQIAQGIWPEAAWTDPDFALETADLSSKQRAKATEILLNPEGKALADQLKTLFE